MKYIWVHTDVSALVSALGWALLHSLWQASLCALVVWVFRPRLAHAYQRYWLAFGALMAVLVSGLATFAWYIEPVHAILPSAADLPTATPSRLFFLPKIAFMPAYGLQYWVVQYAPWAVGVWAAGAVAGLLRLGSGWWYVQQLRRHAVPLAGTWMHLCQHLAQQMTYTRPIMLATSSWVSSPVAFGWWRPVILMPIGLVNQLPIEQVEAILVHELAHLRRSDWLAQLAQALVETLFYYHPGVWWLAKVMRIEREYACDDWVVRLTGSPVQYAKTLVFLQEKQPVVATPRLSLALQGADRAPSPFARRIRRLLLPSTETTTYLSMEKTLVLFLVAAATMLVGFQKANLPSASEKTDSVSWVDPIVQPDTLPKPPANGRISFDDGKKKVDMRIENGVVKELTVDGQPISPEHIHKYKELTDIVLSNLPAPPPPPPLPPVPSLPSVPSSSTPAAPMAPEAPAAPEEMEALFSPEVQARLAAASERVARISERLAPTLTEEALHAEELGALAREKAMHEMSRLKSIHERQLTQEQQAALMEVEVELRQVDNELQRAQEQILAHDEHLVAHAAELAAQAHADVAHAYASVAERTAHSQNPLKAMLRADGLLDESGRIRFKLTSKSLTVNGKKQSDILHQKYLNLYRVQTGRSMTADGAWVWEER